MMKLNKYQKQAFKETLTAIGVFAVMLGIPAVLFVASEYLFGNGFPAMVLMLVGIMFMFYKVSVYEAMNEDASKRNKKKRKR